MNVWNDAAKTLWPTMADQMFEDIPTRTSCQECWYESYVYATSGYRSGKARIRHDLKSKLPGIVLHSFFESHVRVVPMCIPISQLVCLRRVEMDETNALKWLAINVQFNSPSAAANSRTRNA